MQSPLLHPKWGARYPPRNCSGWYSRLFRDLRGVPAQSNTCAQHSSATCCSLGIPYKLRCFNKTNLQREPIAAGASQMLTFQVFETIRWWLPYSCLILNERGLNHFVRVVTVFRKLSAASSTQTRSSQRIAFVSGGTKLRAGPPSARSMERACRRQGARACPPPVGRLGRHGAGNAVLAAPLFPPEVLDTWRAAFSPLPRTAFLAPRASTPALFRQEPGPSS